MIYEELLPHVLTAATSCPRDTALRHIRMAAIEFFERAPVWRVDMDGIISDGLSTQFAAPIDDQVEVSRIFSCYVEAEPYDIVLQDTGNHQARVGGSRRIAWTDNRRRLFVSPAPASGAVIGFNVALKPSLKSFEFDDAMGAHYFDALVHGALARILSVPGADWVDVRSADRSRAAFEHGINEATRVANGGHGRAGSQSSVRFF